MIALPLLVLISALLAYAIMGLMITLVDQDEEYAMVGLGSVTESAANTYSIASIDDIIEPTIIYDLNFSGNKLVTKIENILVWDVREFVFSTLNETPITSLEDDVIRLRAGIAKDNTLDKTGFPSTLPQVGGEGATVVGASSGTLNVMNQDTLPAAEAIVSFLHTGVEENATGEIVIENEDIIHYKYPRKSDGGNQSHHVMTHANYYAFAVAAGFVAAQAISVAMDARLVSIDIDELFADRQVILNLADALTILTI